ncbi:ankyrin repeat domain-containing protein 7-like [Mya arenaria]|uniref:ankyrin repeat domain-containing protein 7-like n=1 Tax=Mya arenaria TaxID=6604 RepID=UPI0022E2B6A4|nr:ankyrin repeat domain-containing protein 7-like [Mya arenaria]
MDFVKSTIDSKARRSQSMWTLHRQNTWVATSRAATLPQQLRAGSVIDICDASYQEKQKSIIRRLRNRDHKERKDKSSSTRTMCTPCLQGDIDAVDSEGRTLLFYAARYGQVDTVRQLVEAGCDIDQVDALGNSPLHEAVDKWQLEIAKIFLRDGKVDVNVTGCHGETPFMRAVTNGDADAVRLLHRHGADINMCDTTGCSPICRALQRGLEKIADFLLDNKCDVNTTTPREMTCFFHKTSSKDNIYQISKRISYIFSDYNFKQDSDWLEAEGCPITIKDSKLLHKVLIKACQDCPTTRRPSRCSGKQKIIKTFRCIFKRD